MVCICRTMISEVHYKVEKSSEKDTKLNPAEKNRARIFRFSYENLSSSKSDAHASLVNVIFL